MNQTFQVRVHRALEDPALAQALGHVSGQLRTRRAIAFESLPDAEVIRDQARAGRLDTLRDLARQLEAFETQLRANGVHVHWAESAEDANQLVVDIAARHGVRRVAKAKSMVSEEIHLNEALAAAGGNVAAAARQLGLTRAQMAYRVRRGEEEAVERGSALPRGGRNVGPRRRWGRETAGALGSGLN